MYLFVVGSLLSCGEQFTYASIYGRQFAVRWRTAQVTNLMKECFRLTDSKTKCVANSSPVTHQTLRQQGGTGEDGHIYLADQTVSVAVIEKKADEEETDRLEKTAIFILQTGLSV